MEFCYHKGKNAFYILHAVSVHITQINSPTVFLSIAAKQSNKISHCKTRDSIEMIANPIEKRFS